MFFSFVPPVDTHFSKCWTRCVSQEGSRLFISFGARFIATQTTLRKPGEALAGAPLWLRDFLEKGGAPKTLLKTSTQEAEPEKLKPSKKKPGK